MDIGPGDFMECVDASPGYVWGTPLPYRMGSVAIVRKVNVIEDDSCPHCGQNIAIVMIDFDHQTCIHRWKPFHGPEIEKQQFKLKEPA